MQRNSRGMSAVKTASSSPLRTFALVSISSGRVSEKGDTRNAAGEDDRSVVSPSAHILRRSRAGGGEGGITHTQGPNARRPCCPRLSWRTAG